MLKVFQLSDEPAMTVQPVPSVAWPSTTGPVAKDPAATTVKVGETMLYLMGLK